MDPLEEKIRKKFTSIKAGSKKLLETNIIHSIEVKEKIAYIQLLFSTELNNSKLLDSEQQKDLQKKISSALLELEEIEDTRFSKSVSSEEAQTKSRANRTIPAQANPQNTSLLQNYKNIIVVASGKGGVGKSTVALNLALALHKLGYSTALFDADIYGPSIPMMTGTRNIRLTTHQEKLAPLEKFGIEFISIGNLVKEGDSIVWRGPMVHQAIHQMIRDTLWGGGDFMIIDLPPGTGDVQISISQILKVRAAVIVSTPQDLALIDARRAMVMFEKVDIPIMGIVENMSSFICPKCGEETAIFGTGGAQEESKNLEMSFLGKIPLDLRIRQSGDKGVPLMSLNKTSSEIRPNKTSPNKASPNKKNLCEFSALEESYLTLAQNVIKQNKLLN